MNRLPGRIWYDPGFPSLVVPYHDTNDFFFSGHLGSIVLWMLEFHTGGHKCMVYYCWILIVFMWTFLTMMRVHYCIDLVTGLIAAHCCYMLGEYLNYPIDVKLLGLPHYKRKFHVHQACIRCGWAHYNQSMCIHK